VTFRDIVIQYEARMLELQSAIAQLRWPHALAVSALAVALALFVCLSLYAIRGQLSVLWPALPVPVAAASIRRLQRFRQSQSRIWRLKRFYERALQRVNGNWARTGSNGEEFTDPNHVYSADLNICGEGSLFELLCIARTSLGRRGLADYLLKTPVLEETLLRQEAVRELCGRTELRERIATLGEFDFLEARDDTFHQWLNSPRLSFARALRPLAALTSSLLAGIVLGGLLGLIPWIDVALYSAPLIGFHAVMGACFRARVNRMLEWLRPVAAETRVLREGLRLLEEERFQSAKLRQLSEQVRNGSRSIRKLERLLGILHQRDKDWFAVPSRLLLVGTQACLAVEQWRENHGPSLGMWLEAWAEFEALNSLGAYGYENPDNTFPEFGETCFQASDLAHPLLPRAACVANDIELSRDTPFYIVSGSNMSGKSTLLRAIGLNAVLAFAGAPVRARALRLSGLSIFASLSVVDSLLNGKSKFLAEVDRLRQAIESNVPHRPVLFLVDEIFGGTNSRDRRIAAEAVVRTLVSQGAIGALSTHDLALTEMAGAVNVHMGSRTQGDPMDFDYRLKPGVTTETNALAIARLAGVPV
jgi:hypothetical protein